MGELIYFVHIRRSMRLFNILVGQYGLDHFVESDRGLPVVDVLSLEESVLFASDWMELRTGMSCSLSTKNRMRRAFYRVLVEKIEEESVVFHPCPSDSS
ncbi:MAG: hypothetical protein GY822_30870 [Deltaproteobacteria bacterium]|nr:hypothetical protein [Deltaproteobacteria bacterium]